MDLRVVGSQTVTVAGAATVLILASIFPSIEIKQADNTRKLCLSQISSWKVIDLARVRSKKVGKFRIIERRKYTETDYKFPFRPVRIVPSKDDAETKASIAIAMYKGNVADSSIIDMLERGASDQNLRVRDMVDSLYKTFMEYDTIFVTPEVCTVTVPDLYLSDLRFVEHNQYIDIISMESGYLKVRGWFFELCRFFDELEMQPQIGIKDIIRFVNNEPYEKMVIKYNRLESRLELHLHVWPFNQAAIVRIEKITHSDTGIDLTAIELLGPETRIIPLSNYLAITGSANGIDEGTITAMLGNITDVKVKYRLASKYGGTGVLEYPVTHYAQLNVDMFGYLS